MIFNVIKSIIKDFLEYIFLYILVFVLSTFVLAWDQKGDHISNRKIVYVGNEKINCLRFLFQELKEEIPFSSEERRI